VIVTEIEKAGCFASLKRSTFKFVSKVTYKVFHETLNPLQSDTFHFALFIPGMPKKKRGHFVLWSVTLEIVIRSAQNLAQ